MECSKNRRCLILWASAILIGALVIRIAAAVAWQSSLDSTGERFRFGDSETYWVLAENIIQEGRYEYGGVDSRAFRAPGYPLLLVGTMFLSQGIVGHDSVLVARLVGCVLGAATIALLMVATFRMLTTTATEERFVNRSILCCGVFASLYLGAIGMSIFILSEAIFCPLMVLSLFAWNRSQEPNVKSSRFWQLLAGVATGAACLSRPSWILWPGLLVVMSLIRWRFPSIFGDRVEASADPSGVPAATPKITLPKVCRSLVWFGFAMAAFMAPWWIRNYFVFEAFVPTTLQVGASLYDGLHDGASGASDEGMQFTLDTEKELREFDRKWNESKAAPGMLALQADRLVPFEIRLNQALFSKAISWAYENPYATARLALIKFAKMWTPWPTAKEIGGLGVRIVEAVGYLVIVGLAIVGLMTIAPELRYPAMIYASPVLYFAVLHTIFVGSVRYRQPAILVLTIVAGIGAAWMLNQIEMKTKRR